MSEHDIVHVTNRLLGFTDSQNNFRLLANGILTMGYNKYQGSIEWVGWTAQGEGCYKIGIIILLLVISFHIRLFAFLQEMIDEADRDGDGEINEAEFLRIMKKTSLY